MPPQSPQPWAAVACSAGDWSRCPCPAHGGAANSLAIRYNGRRLAVKCHSKHCSRTAILASIDRKLGTHFSGRDLVAPLGPRPAHLTEGHTANTGEEDNSDASTGSGGGASHESTEGGADEAPPPVVTTARNTPPPAGVAAWLGTTTTTTPAKQRAQQPEKKPTTVRDWLRRIWSGAEVADLRSLIARYLIETRGLTLSAIPKTLRYHPRLFHKPTGLYSPAMVALITDYTVHPVALQRIWVNTFTADKAFSTDSRMMLGPCHGGAVHLAGDQDSEKLLVGEGIETVLSAAELAAVGPDVAVWAALSTSGLTTLTVPHRFRHVVIAADNDRSNVGAEAAEALTRRLRRHGIRVEIRMPKTPDTDWNDVLRAKRSGAEADGRGCAA